MLLELLCKNKALFKIIQNHRPILQKYSTNYSIFEIFDHFCDLINLGPFDHFAGFCQLWSFLVILVIFGCF